MANTQGKIERLGLADRVQELLKAGVATGKQIHEELNKDPNVSVGRKAVNKYLNKVKDAVAPDAFKAIRDHVDKVVPEDLKALEEMEAFCLKWAREDSTAMAKRLADTVAEIEKEVSLWADMIQRCADYSQKKITVRIIVKTCLEYIAQDAKLITTRLSAISQASKIIDLKLKNAGMLDPEGKGRIIIINTPEELRALENTNSSETPDGYQRFKIVGGS